MGTFWHILARNKTVKLPSEIIFYDTETLPEYFSKGIEKHVLRLGFACHVVRHKTRLNWTDTWLKFVDKETFWNWVESFSRKRRRIWLIAHNQQFDFMVVDGFGELNKRGWELKWHIITSNLFIARFTKNKGTLIVVDSINWFRSSLKVMGESIGKPKGEINFETCTEQELSDYCYRDVEITRDSVLALIKFVREKDFGSFQFTCAGQAFIAYKHRFMPYKIWIHAHPDAITLERVSYRGGRNEAYYIGEIPETTYYLDVNSLFPFVMEKYEYPCKFRKVISDVSVDRLIGYLGSFAVIARVRIQIQDPFIGLKTNRLMFPIGTFWVTLTSPEIDAVYRTGKILEVGKVALYKKTFLFKKWVNGVYTMRREFIEAGNLVFADFAKISLNSLYGKFGQRSAEFKQIGTADPNVIKVERYFDYETKKNSIEYTYAGKVYLRSDKDKEGRDAFPGIASHVTAYARLYLYGLMCLAKEGNYYYCDTDSLIVNKTGYNNLKHLIDSTKLGYLKVEGVSDRVIIRGCKDYQIDDKVKIKGIKRNSVQLSNGVYLQTRFYKFRSLLRKGSLDAPLTEQFTKTLKRVYLKGNVQSDGHITPFVLSE